MIYLDSFNFASFNNDLDFRPSEVGIGWYDTKYPFGILSQHQIEHIDFEPITVFYGGNGCGKTTALNIIAEKLNLKRDSLYNKSSFFDIYLIYCKSQNKTIPPQSSIITSDDVFEFTMNLRHINQGIDRHREELFNEYDRLKEAGFKLKTLDDFEAYKQQYLPNKMRKTDFDKQKNIREHSNGESAFLFFTNKIKENALYLLDEPENSLSPERQQELLQFIQDSTRFYNCQFVIATHSPFLLSLKDAKIYDFDENPVKVKPWTELKNVRDYYDFFKRHENEFM